MLPVCLSAMFFPVLKPPKTRDVDGLNEIRRHFLPGSARCRREDAYQRSSSFQVPICSNRRAFTMRWRIGLEDGLNATSERWLTGITVRPRGNPGQSNRARQPLVLFQTINNDQWLASPSPIRRIRWGLLEETTIPVGSIDSPEPDPNREPAPRPPLQGPEAELCRSLRWIDVGERATRPPHAIQTGEKSLMTITDCGLQRGAGSRFGSGSAHQSSQPGWFFFQKTIVSP